MKKILFLISFITFLSIGQAKAGVILTDTLEPLLISGAKVKSIADLKCGTESIFHFLGIYTTGYAGVYEIAVRNGINQIHHVDVRKKMFLGIGTTKIMVYGE